MSLPVDATGGQPHGSGVLPEGEAEPELAELHLRLQDDPLDAEFYRALAAAKLVSANARYGRPTALLEVSGAHLRLAQAERALQSDDLPTAEMILRSRLLDEPTDVQALRMMADFASRLGLEDGSGQLLAYAIDSCPASPRHGSTWPSNYISGPATTRRWPCSTTGSISTPRT